MTQQRAYVGSRIDEAGLLLRDSDLLQLRRDLGGRYALEVDLPALGELPLRVRIVGTIVQPGVVRVHQWTCD